MSDDRFEKHRLKIIEERLKAARHTLEGLLPIHAQVDRKVKGLENEIRTLEDERSKLLHGQTVMDFRELDF